MTIHLRNVGKRYNREWIFRRINYQFEKGRSYAITGPNGSGKSTLLKIISGSHLASDGDIQYYHLTGTQISPEYVYLYISFTAPYLNAIRDFTLSEFLRFHFSFKNLENSITLSELPALLQLEHAKDKFIKNFSTGMTQRLKLGVSFFSAAPVLLLDEPATNLDANGVDWYNEQIQRIGTNKLIIVCSNREEEYAYVDDELFILDYK